MRNKTLLIGVIRYRDRRAVIDSRRVCREPEPGFGAGRRRFPDVYPAADLGSHQQRRGGHQDDARSRSRAAGRRRRCRRWMTSTPWRVNAPGQPRPGRPPCYATGDDGDLRERRGLAEPALHRQRQRHGDRQPDRADLAEERQLLWRRRDWATALSESPTRWHSGDTAA